jgi:AcrR family transcriptional regulator
MSVDSKNSSITPGTDKEPKSSKQKRARVTRQQLMTSARAIFARDGFQNARIEDIAAKAGKTRGAFYANFKDKEDVFFQIFEEALDRDMAALRPILQNVPTLEERLHVLAEYLCKLGKDRQRMLLIVEFKMYAIRHPRRRKRLADLHAMMCLRCSLPEIDELLPEYKLQNTTQRRTNSLAMGAIMEGLSVNQLFDPGSLSDDDVVRFLTICLREKLLPGQSFPIPNEAPLFHSFSSIESAPQNVL